MFQVSETAAVVLKDMLSQIDDVQEPRIRLGTDGSEVKLAIDTERPGDTTVQHGSDSLVVMDSGTSETLRDCQLDVDEGMNRLVIKQTQ